jgi:hypothetical protein
MPESADNPLLDFLLAVLASVMAPALGDPNLARRAAQQAIEAYQPTTNHELIATGQILAFTLTALEALRLAAPQEMALSMKLKLRGNANGLNRAASDTTRLLDSIRQTPPALAEWYAPTAPKPPPPPDQSTANPSPNDKTEQSDWAAAMTRVAAKLQANTLHANPKPAASVQQTVNALWIDTLKTVAGEIAPTRRHKTQLLQTTSLATNPPPART